MEYLKIKCDFKAVGELEINFKKWSLLLYKCIFGYQFGHGNSRIPWFGEWL